MKYRAEIDGLRAVAILPVVAFHMGLPSFSGGYTGVDVFFVISGFLITSIIWPQIEKRNYSLWQFYKRRALRLLPALVLVVVAVLIASFFLMLPNEFHEVNRSATAAALFVSNFFFLFSGGYFDAPAEMKPLLHTWSLAVEEQFYIFFPLFLVFLFRWKGKNLTIPLWLTILGSFALSVFGLLKPLYLLSSATFYLLPTRAWELGIGAAVALTTLHGAKVRLSQVKVEFLSFLGIALIAFGVFALNADSYFPAWNALYPCVGAALVIAFAQETCVGAVLRWRPLVYIGLISYSLYLWHWPVIVFAKMLMPGVSNLYFLLIVLAVSFVAAVVTTRYVEKPFREMGKSISPKRTVCIATCVLAMIVIGGGVSARTSLAENRYPPEVLRIASYTSYPETRDFVYQFRPGQCMLDSETKEGFDAYDKMSCLRMDSVKPNYLVLGDSHGAHIWRALQENYPNINFLQATASGCRPILDAKGEDRCVSLMNFIFYDFLKKNKVDAVLVFGRWKQGDVSSLIKTAAYLKGLSDKVAIFGPTVEYKGAFPVLLAQSIYHKDESLVRRSIDSSRQTLDTILRDRFRNENIDYVSMQQVVCPEGKCPTLADGDPVWFDYGHLTLQGARLVARQLREFAPSDLALR